MTADLSALIARLEAAEVGSRELDESLWIALDVPCHNSYVPPATTSLDAALALAERAGVCRLWNLWKSNSGYVASFEGDKYSRSSTPALALVIATLRAKLDGYAAEGEVNKNPKAQEGGMGEQHTSFGWAVLYPHGRGFYCPGAPAIDSVSFTREAAMHNFVAGWRHDGHDGMSASKVWQRAYRRGWRLSRVAVTPAFGGPA